MWRCSVALVVLTDATNSVRVPAYSAFVAFLFQLAPICTKTFGADEYVTPNVMVPSTL